MTGCDGSRYSHCAIAPVDASSSDAETPERPAVVGHRHEEARRQTVERGDLAADERHLPAEAHRADLEAVHRRHDRRFELRQPRIRVHIVERAEELFLRVQIAGRAVAADADADRAGRAAFALRLPHGVEDALLHAVEVAIGAAEMRKLDGHGVLRVGVLAAAAFQDQLDLDLILVPLIEVNDGRARAEVVAGVLARDRVHRVRPELAAPGGFGHRLANLLAHPDLVGADGHLDLERRHAGVLADGAFAVGGEIDVLRDDGQGLRRPRGVRLGAAGDFHRGAHIGRKVGRRSDDELKHAVEE